MRQLQATRFGEPTEVLEIADVDQDAIGDGEIRIASEAVGLNFLDVSMCRGDHPAAEAFPLTFGAEVSGRIIETGAGCADLLGQDVIACPTLPRGALGDSVVVDARYAVVRPGTLDAITAAALPITYQTAWFALERAGVTSGSVVLVTAAAGGVGVAVTQLAVARGAKVIAAAGGAEKVAICAAQGADAVIDYLTADVATATMDVTDGIGVDAVVDQVGGPRFVDLLDIVRFEGSILAIGTAGGPIPPIDPMAVTARNVNLVGLAWGSAYPLRAPAAVAGAYRQLFELCRSGSVRPLVSRVVTLEETPEALAALAERRTTGKIVVAPNPARHKR